MSALKECREIIERCIPERFPLDRPEEVITFLRKSVAGGKRDGLQVELIGFTTPGDLSIVNMRDPDLIDFLGDLADKGVSHELVYGGVSWVFFDSESPTYLSARKVIASS